MIDKINVLFIVREHFLTLRNYSTGRLSYFDCALFLLFPFALSFGLVFAGVGVSKDLANMLVTVASIFAGLLLNLMVLIYTIMVRMFDAEAVERRQEKWTVVREVYSNVSFCVLTCVVAAVLCLLVRDGASGYLSKTNVVCIYFLFSNVVLTLLMILKRIHILFQDEIRTMKFD